MKKLILITNDDGFQAQGIGYLTQLMSRIGDVVVVAPDVARSGAACSITPTIPISLRRVTESTSLLSYKGQNSKSKIVVFACSGTPTDCVKLAIEKCCPRRPDLMVSGINHGDNASCSIHYSGTMGAVIESCMKGIPSIGYSLRTLSHQCDFTPYSSEIERIARYVLQYGLPQDVCLNVNFPEVPHLTGTRVCRMARGNWEHEWEPVNNPRGGEYFWLTGRFRNMEPEAEDTDYWALDHGYAAVTPVRLDMTDYTTLTNLAQQL